MRQHMDEGSVWDAYILGCIVWQHMRAIYLPATNIGDNDAACERLRSCVHQVTTTMDGCSLREVRDLKKSGYAACSAAVGCVGVGFGW